MLPLLSLANKLLIYKTILKPVWTYEIELWGCATKSDTAILQRYQSKLLRTITNAPWYVTNHTLRTDLHIPYVYQLIHDRVNKYRTALAFHPNPLWNFFSNQYKTDIWNDGGPSTKPAVASLDANLHLWQPERLRWHRQRTDDQDSKLAYRKTFIVLSDC